MFLASTSRMPSDLDRATFSLPARSIKLSCAIRSPCVPSSSSSCTTAWDRDECSFIAVPATARMAEPSRRA